MIWMCIFQVVYVRGRQYFRSYISSLWHWKNSSYAWEKMPHKLGIMLRCRSLHLIAWMIMAVVWWRLCWGLFLGAEDVNPLVPLQLVHCTSQIRDFLFLVWSSFALLPLRWWKSLIDYFLSWVLLFQTYMKALLWIFHFRELCSRLCQFLFSIITLLICFCCSRINLPLFQYLLLLDLS